jgi:hypothetical protein
MFGGGRIFVEIRIDTDFPVLRAEARGGQGDDGQTLAKGTGMG